MGEDTVDLLRKLVAERRSSDSVEEVLIGLVGRGIQLSRTPAMHEQEAARLGFRTLYLSIDFDHLGLSDAAIGDVLNAAESVGFRGLNITHPFKQLAVTHADILSPEACSIGAINTLVYTDRGRVGHNTDSLGFACSFREGMAGVPLGKVALFGAGGAGAAVAYSLMELGVGRLHLFDEDAEKAEALAARMSQAFNAQISCFRDPVEALNGTDGVVNTTPVGMAKYPGMPFSSDLLTAKQWVADVIYFPAETELLRQARSLGCRTLPGIGMAIHQAVCAFELFTGRAADGAAMARHFEAAA